MANRGLGFHQDAFTFDEFLTDLIDTLVAPANGTGWSEVAGGSGVPHRRILQHADGIFLDVHRKAFRTTGPNPGDNRADTWYLELFLGFFSEYDAVNKRPAPTASVAPLGAVLASNLNQVSNFEVMGPGADYGSWTGQFYWWVDARGFCALFKPDAPLAGWGQHGGAVANTALLVLERTLPSEREQAGGSNFVAYTTGAEAGTVSGGWGGGYYAGQEARRLDLMGAQSFWDLGGPEQPTWYDRWPLVHPFNADNGSLTSSRTTGHAGRGTVPGGIASPTRYGGLWPSEAGGGVSEEEGAYGGARRAQGGNDRVYFQFPWYADDYRMQRVLTQTQYFFRGQVARGMADGDQVAWAAGGSSLIYLYKVFGSFAQGVFIRYA